METRIPEVYEACVESRDEAINILNNKIDWCWGLIFSVLYRDDDDIVQVLTAVGIKNCDECGPNGVADSDEWTNTYYEYSTDAHGEEFYRIIGDSGSNGNSGSNNTDELYTTKVNLNGTNYKVLNPRRDTEIADPFQVQEL